MWRAPYAALLLASLGGALAAGCGSSADPEDGDLPTSQEDGGESNGASGSGGASSRDGTGGNSDAGTGGAFSSGGSSSAGTGGTISSGGSSDGGSSTGGNSSGGGSGGGSLGQDCSDFPLTAPPVYQRSVSDEPPEPKGFALFDGAYDITDSLRFGPGALDPPLAETLVFSGDATKVDFVQATDEGLRRTSFDLQIDGSELLLTATCPEDRAGAEERVQFSGTLATLVLHRVQDTVPVLLVYSRR